MPPGLKPQRPPADGAMREEKASDKEEGLFSTHSEVPAWRSWGEFPCDQGEPMKLGGQRVKGTTHKCCALGTEETTPRYSFLQRINPRSESPTPENSCVGSRRGRIQSLIPSVQMDPHTNLQTWETKWTFWACNWTHSWLSQSLQLRRTFFEIQETGEKFVESWGIFYLREHAYGIRPSQEGWMTGMVLLSLLTQACPCANMSREFRKYWQRKLSKNVPIKKQQYDFNTNNESSTI